MDKIRNNPIETHIVQKPVNKIKDTDKKDTEYPQDMEVCSSEASMSARAKGIAMVHYIQGAPKEEKNALVADFIEPANTATHESEASCRFDGQLKTGPEVEPINKSDYSVSPTPTADFIEPANTATHESEASCRFDGQLKTGPEVEPINKSDYSVSPISATRRRPTV